MRVHEAIVAVLKDVGVDVIFGGAGEESMGMQIAVAQAAGVRGIIPKHEQNASFMACGYALFSGKLGVCFSTAGPGAFNLLSGVCAALNGSLPLIAITGYATMAYDGGAARPTRLRGSCAPPIPEWSGMPSSRRTRRPASRPII